MLAEGDVEAFKSAMKLPEEYLQPIGTKGGKRKNLFQLDLEEN